MSIQTANIPTNQPQLEPTVQPSAESTSTGLLSPTLSPSPFPTPTSTVALLPGAIAWFQACEHIGAGATVCGPVVQATFAESSNGQPTFLNLGLPYPDPARFTVLIWGSDRSQFSEPPEVIYLDQNICISGTVELYQGSAEMVVSEPGQIVVHP